jgi:hypothetical protein
LEAVDAAVGVWYLDFVAHRLTLLSGRAWAVGACAPTCRGRSRGELPAVRNLGQERGLSNLPTTLLSLSSASDCGKRSSGGRALRVVRIRPRPRLVCLVTLRLLLLGEGALTWERGRLGRRRRRLRIPAEQLVDRGANGHGGASLRHIGRRVHHRRACRTSSS